MARVPRLCPRGRVENIRGLTGGGRARLVDRTRASNLLGNPAREMLGVGDMTRYQPTSVIITLGP